MNTKKIRTLLNDLHLKCTTPRASVLKVLLNAKGPLSQEQISEKIGNDAPDKATIYRTLEKLVEARVVHRAFLHERTWRYELSNHCTESQCHPHFRCKICGRTYCLKKMKMPMAKTPYMGYIIEHQRVELEGICPACNLCKQIKAG